MAPKLTDYSVLSFDCYGTLIDWETGIYAALSRLICHLPPSSPYKEDRPALLKALSKEEETLCLSRPGLPYPNLLAEAYTRLCAALSLPPPDALEARVFGASVSSWPAFADSVAALEELKTRYKLVVLSNVDNTSFAGTLKGGLEGVEFDAVYTAEDIGTYKPNVENFHYLLANIEQEFGVEKENVLHVGHGLKADHVPAKTLGLDSVWIRRRGGPIEEVRDKAGFRWEFETMAEMAEAVKKEKQGSS